jgi:heterodisulfide reductase subunit B
LLKETNEALAAAGLHYNGGANVRHMVEVLIEDFGYDGLKAPMKKSLEGLKIAGYVGCQTNRPFGIDGESFENPMYLDKMVETLGGEARFPSTNRRSPAAAARWPFPSRKRARSRSATSSSRPTTTAPR